MVDRFTGEKLFKELSAVKDQGAESQCCDHPYTIIEITRAHGQKQTLTTGFDLLKQYQRESEGRPIIFGIDCTKVPHPYSEKYKNKN